MAIPKGTFVYRDGEVVLKQHAEPLNLGFLSRSERVAAPMLIPDTIEMRSMADGKVYTSKSHYRQSLKAHGYREVGNEIAAHVAEATAERPRPAIQPDLIEAYGMVKQGYKPVVEPAADPDLD
jgi:hypothetical protein